MKKHQNLVIHSRSLDLIIFKPPQQLQKSWLVTAQKNIQNENNVQIYTSNVVPQL